MCFRKNTPNGMVAAQTRMYRKTSRYCTRFRIVQKISSVFTVAAIRLMPTAVGGGSTSISNGTLIMANPNPITPCMKPATRNMRRAMMK